MDYEKKQLWINTRHDALLKLDTKNTVIFDERVGVTDFYKILARHIAACELGFVDMKDQMYNFELDSVLGQQVVIPMEHLGYLMDAYNWDVLGSFIDCAIQAKVS